MRPPLSIRIHDATIGIWQDNPQDPSFRSEIYGAIIKQMRARGWSIKRNDETHKRFPSISPSRRSGARGTLRCDIQIAGRSVEVQFWSVTAPQINTNGRRYDFDKMRRMHSMDRRRVELEFRRIATWLETLAPVEISRSDDRDMPTMKRIEKSYAESWHKDKTLGRPVPGSDLNRRGKDGTLLEQGQTVWFAGRKGRIVRGLAYYNINNMWWVVAGGELFNEPCSALSSGMPERIRTKRNDRERRNRLERELQIAVQRMDFQRAQILKTIVFGNEQTFMIWARDHSAYYRSQYAGYTKDSIAAGKYTRAEAEAECRRVPHELEMVCPDGRHVSFEERKLANG